MTSNKKPVAGDLVHFRSSMSVVLGDNQGKVFHRGEELLLTEQIIEDAKGRDGTSWIDIASDPQAQVLKWGRQVVGVGPVPDGIEWFNENPGDAAWDVARIQQRDAAAEYSDPRDRAAADKRVRETFGTVPTSWSQS